MYRLLSYLIKIFNLIQDPFVDDSKFEYYLYDGYDGSDDVYDYPESALPTYSPGILHMREMN